MNWFMKIFISPTSKKRFKTLGIVLLWTSAILFYLLPILFCLYIGITKEYLYKQPWQLKSLIKFTEITFLGLSSFGKEVAKYIMSFVLGYWIFFEEKGGMKMKKINIFYLLLIPTFFVVSIGVEKAAAKGVAYIRATVLPLQDDAVPNDLGSMNEKYTTTPPTGAKP